MKSREGDVERDASGLEILTSEESLALLRQANVGRVVFTSAALPAVLPVNYVVDDDGAILLRIGSQTRLAAATGTVVAFEVDEINPADDSWSVVVTGRASIVRDPAMRARIDTLGLRSWVPNGRDLPMRIEPELVTGRRLPAVAELLLPADNGRQAG